MFADPPEWAPASRAVLLQEAIGDSQVPNMSTEMLARGLSIKLLDPWAQDVPGLSTVTAPTTESALAQIYLRNQVDANPPPEENLPAEQGNNAHSDIIFLPQVEEQTLQFLTTGEIIQNCDGACDPD